YRRGEREPSDLLGPQRRHLGGDPPAHRFPDHVRPLQPERVDDVEDEQEQIELVVEAVEPGRLAEAGKERRVHVMGGGGRGWRASPRREPPGAGREGRGRPGARLEDLDLRSARAEIEQAGARGIGAHAATTRPLLPRGRSTRAWTASDWPPGTLR